MYPVIDKHIIYPALFSSFGIAVAQMNFEKGLRIVFRMTFEIDIQITPELFGIGYPEDAGRFIAFGSFHPKRDSETT